MLHERNASSNLAYIPHPKYTPAARPKNHQPPMVPGFQGEPPGLYWKFDESQEFTRTRRLGKYWGSQRVGNARRQSRILELHACLS
jgi:hypothetical protein